MDTVYYNVNAQRVKVSGGADLVRLVPVPAVEPELRDRGERVLDFERCRRKLETKAAWKRLEEMARDVDGGLEEERPAPSPAAPGRWERCSGWMEVCASAAIIVMCATAALAFLTSM